MSLPLHPAATTTPARVHAARVAVRLATLIVPAALALTGCASMGGMRRSAPPLETAPVRSHEVGTASVYADRFDGLRTASGERYDPRRLTAAHRTLPFGTRIRVTNLRNDRSVIVTVNDRGPVSHARIVDLSGRAARALAIGSEGLARVRLDVID